MSNSKEKDKDSIERIYNCRTCNTTHRVTLSKKMTENRERFPFPYVYLHGDLKDLLTTLYIDKDLQIRGSEVIKLEHSGIFSEELALKIANKLMEEIEKLQDENVHLRGLLRKIDINKLSGEDCDEPKVDKQIAKSIEEISIFNPEFQTDFEKFDRDLVSNWQDLIGSKKAVVDQLKTISDLILEEKGEREKFLIIIRDVFHQMRNLSRESASNVDKKDVIIFEDVIKEEDNLQKLNKTYLNALREISMQSKYLYKSYFDFIDTYKDLSSKRKNYIKKSIKLYQRNINLDEEERLKILEQKLSNDLQKFKQAKLTYFKKEEELQEIKQEFNVFWIKLKESIQEFS